MTLGAAPIRNADNRSEGEDARCLSHVVKWRVRGVFVVSEGTIDRRGDRNEDEPTQLSQAQVAKVT
jgi:hypothetical protein